MNDIIPKEFQNLWDRFSLLEDKLNSLFEFNKPYYTYLKQKTYPKINVRETEKKYIVEIVAPGYDPENINLFFENGSLTVTSQKINIELNDDEKYIYREISKRAFSRSIPFKKEIDSNNIKAKYDKGIVYVTLPKKNKTLNKKIKIKIKGGDKNTK